MDILRQGTTVWNAWREAHPNVTPDLNKARLAGINLTGANLSSVYFKETGLVVGADLRGCLKSRP